MTTEYNQRIPLRLHMSAKGGVVVLCLAAYLRFFGLTLESSSNSSFRGLMRYTYAYHDESDTGSTDLNATPQSRIAIISSFVPSQQYANTNRVQDLDHIINKACYSYIWGYDFIFNMTFGFDTDVVEKGKYWLDYGTWSRVPHIQDRIDDYDWILYADTDFVIQDFATPIESFFAEWKFYNRTPSLLLPRDLDFSQDKYYVFSAFALLIKSSEFGKAILNNWMEFAHGICEKGNLSPTPRSYDWQDSDQPGIWYSIVKTHMDYNKNNHTLVNQYGRPICNNSTGLLDTDRGLGPELNQYCARAGMKHGAFGDDLQHVPHNQPVLWSTPTVTETSSDADDNNKRRDFGVQLKFGVDDNNIEKVTRHAWGIHESRKHRWPAKAHDDLEVCKKVHGCYAEYREDNKLHIGCRDREYVVALPSR